MKIQEPKVFNDWIIEKVCGLISQQDRINLAKTCRSWYFVVIPVLYRRVIISGSQCHDDRSFTKLKFDNCQDMKFDSWENFKIPLENLKKFRRSLRHNSWLCSNIEVLEIFDCYRTELRFYILEILSLIVESSCKFHNFRCHHTISNQFYYQCLCYQDYWRILMNYISKGYKTQSLCLNFNDFIRCSMMEENVLDRVESFEIILNPYELASSADLSNYQQLRLFQKVKKLSIGFNVDTFISFANKYNHKFSNVTVLNITITYVHQDLLRFVEKFPRLKKLGMNFDSDDFYDEFPLKLMQRIKELRLENFLIKLNNNKIHEYVMAHFPELSHLAILSNCNNFENLKQIIKGLPRLKYLNYQFVLSRDWLMEQNCDCNVCCALAQVKNNKLVLKIFIEEIMPFICHKHDYKILDFDMDVDRYPFGVMNEELLQKVAKLCNMEISLDTCELIYKYISHILQAKIGDELSCRFVCVSGFAVIQR